MADFTSNKKYSYVWQSAKFKDLAFSGSNVSQFVNDAGYITSSVAISASYALSASYSQTASYFAGTVTSASYALTASYFSGTVTSASYALTSSYSTYAETSSYSQNSSDIIVLVLNQSGNNIAKGIVVRITGSNNSSDIPRIVTASYENDNNSANTLGITREAIANGDLGYVITEGVLTGINTTSFISGQLLYLGATGSITGSAPLAPLHAVRLGEVIRHQSNNGSIYVRIDNGYELGELHDVRDTTTTSSYGDLLVKSGSVWTNLKQLTGSYGLTGSLNATSFTGSLSGTSSYATTALSASFASTVPASGVIGLTSTQIATGSVTASVSPTQFTVVSGSSTELTVTGTGVTLGNILTDTHRVTGSLLVTGSLGVNGNINTNGAAGSSTFGSGQIIANSLGNSVGSGFYSQIGTGTGTYGGYGIGYGTTIKWLFGMSKNVTDTTSLVFYEDGLAANLRLSIATGGNVGIGVSKPLSILHTFSTNQLSQMTLGSTNGVGLTVSNTDNYYGLNFGTAVSGDGWIQQGTTTGSATSYNLSLQASGGRVSIGAISPQARLDIRAQGALSTDIAFRVRNSLDTQNLMSITGDGRVAIGLNAQILGTTDAFKNVVIGGGAKDIPSAGVTENSVAFGYNAISNNGGTAIGANTSITGVQGVALGASAIAGISSTAIGATARADATSGYQSLAIGYGARASALLSGIIAVGQASYTNALGQTLAFCVDPVGANSQTMLLTNKANLIFRNSTQLTSGTHWDTTATNTLTIHSGSIPATTISGAFQMYAATGSISNNARPHFRTGNGTIVWLGDESRLFNVTASSIISSGSITVGNITSTPSTENTLNVYPPLAGGTGEGGQILLAASGGLYTSASMLDTWQDYFRILRGTNTGGSNAQLLGLDLQTGNLSIAGAVIPSAWTAGQVIKDTILSNTEVTVSTTTIATSTSDTDFVTYSYTPVSSNSYLVIHYHLASYDFTGGTGNDSYISRIKVDGTEITYSSQSTVNGFRTGVLFPLTGRYTNSNTTAKSIVVAARRNSADDSITIVNTATSMWLRITEIAR